MLHWKISARGGTGTHVMLYGEINEGTTFGELKRLKGRVVMDLAGVKRINSFGVRELLTFFETVRSGAQVETERCSPAIVNQLNLLPTLSRAMIVRSILAPVECPGCLQELEVEVPLRGGGGPGSVPATQCDDCGGPMELSEPAERYFAFLEG
jgi:anti-anti-sigma regulatory factor